MKIFILLLLILTNGFIFSQEKVDWSVQYNKSESNVDIIANIASGWHLYSQHINTEIGPIPTVNDDPVIPVALIYPDESNELHDIGPTIEILDPVDPLQTKLLRLAPVAPIDIVPPRPPVPILILPVLNV